MRRVVPIMLIAAVIAGTLFVAFTRSHREPGLDGPVLSARFLDADLGNAVVLRTPEGSTVVVDPPSGRAAQGLWRILKDEHVGNVSVVLTSVSPGQVTAIRADKNLSGLKRIIRPRTDAESEPAMTAAPRNPITAGSEVTVSCGEKIRLSPTVQLEALSPSDEADKRGADGTLVFRVSFGEKSILFPADLGPKGESALIRSGLNLTSSVFVAAQHGQYGSNSLEMLSMVRPEVIVLRVGGAGASPSNKVLDRLSARNTGAALYRTDEDGIVEIDTNGRSIRVSTQGGER